MAGAAVGHTRQAAKVDRDGLVQLQTPNSGQPAAAHPFVNVVVRFGATSTQTHADPSSFRAKLGSRSITNLFVDETAAGQVIGKRAQLPADLLQLKNGKNVLRLRVRSVPQETANGIHRTFRDGDRVKFRAKATPNTAPVANAIASASVIAIDTPITFDGSASHDDDLDTLTYQWDFGDGATAAGPLTTHAFAATDVARLVSLTVSDGQATTTAQITLRPPPPVCDPNILPGVLVVEGTEALELGAIDVGGSATKTFTVRNSDPGPTSQLKVRIDIDGPGFSVEPANVVLDAGASMPITVRFDPTAPGHVAAHLGVLPCDPAQPAIALLAHGFGGSGGPTGPTLAAAPVFSIAPGSELAAWLPNGDRMPIDLVAGHCERRNGNNSDDLCIADRDCNGNETCAPSRGPRDRFEPTDYCGDDSNYLYVLAANSVNDPNDLVTGSLVRYHLGPNGAVDGRKVLRRITDSTEHMACDRLAPEDGGAVFLAERHPISGDVCLRDERESFTAVQKTNGDRNVIGGIDRIDAFEAPPLDACDDDLSEVDDLQVSADGNSAYFIGSDTGGVYRLRSAPLQILRSSALLRNSHVQVHPLGNSNALLYATTDDVGTNSRVNLYVILPEQAESGALSLENLSPCASYTVPNQRLAGSNQQALAVITFAAGPAASAAGESTVLVSVLDPFTFSNPLGLRATVAFTVAADATSCAAVGVINLDRSLGLRF